MTATATADARALAERLDREKPLNGRIRELAAELGKRHELAGELWASGGFHARMLSLLVLDLKQVDPAHVEALLADLESMEGKQQSQLLDWLIANVIMKKASLKKAAASWRTDPAEVRRRVFWSVQARSVRAENRALNEELLGHVERELATAPAPIQWNMNWCAAQIGIADAELRARCVALGERLGLYRDYPVPKGCTSPYLPSWIGSVVGKRGGG